MADKKVSQLTALATTTSEDLLLIVDDPNGTPASKNITIKKFFGAVPANTVFSGAINIIRSANTVFPSGNATFTKSISMNVSIRSGLTAQRTAAPTVASATTIAPTTQILFVSGTTPIVTITAPSPISTGGGAITLIPTGIFTTTTGGNIALASTAVVSRPLTMVYDATAAKWYPSY
jgi:hypothetical protein